MVLFGVTNLVEPEEAGNAKLADAYTDMFGYEEALPFCFKALEIYQNKLGHDLWEV